ncbi:Hypothetical_protein [Hexamita inflata]|uniref:Hypothetical_protein n=1 Tax=Hexamita inflata TaxID=28002 RepID=A0AA86N8Z1_9EUKA|nr:Hypothetical protein HINF_LOCUS2561 [Hexamita inflata]
MNYSAHKPMFFFWQFVSIDSYSLGKICPGRLGVKIQSTDQNFTDLFRTSNIQQILSKAILKDSQHMSVSCWATPPIFTIFLTMITNWQLIAFKLQIYLELLLF